MWEYKFLPFDLGGGKRTEACEAELNSEAANGWEVVTVMPKMGSNESWCIALLKRLKISSTGD
jgi:hypothetical protein